MVHGCESGVIIVLVSVGRTIAAFIIIAPYILRRNLWYLTVLQFVELEFTSQ